MRGLFSQDDQLSSRELTEISCDLTILSFTVLILLYTFVVLCCTFYERNLRCGRPLGIHLPTGSLRYRSIDFYRICQWISRIYTALLTASMFLPPLLRVRPPYQLPT